MGTTTNNGWPTPVQTDLVKDGWEAIKDLGDAIDTTLGVYSPTTSGLVLLNTTSFSAVATQSFNNVFSATYENYRVLFELTATSASPAMNLRLRVGGVDASGGNYNGGGYFVRSTSATVNGQDLNAGTRFELGGASSAQSSNRYVMDFQSPFLAQRTGHHTFSTGHDGTSAYGRAQHSNHNLSTSYDGFTIFPSSGTITGKVAIYGYNF
jgi:hypothetical protein